MYNELLLKLSKQNKFLDTEEPESDIFPSHDPLEDERFKEVCNLVAQHGLEGLYEKLADFGIGKDFYLSKNDFLYLVSLDKNINKNLPQPDSQPLTCPPNQYVIKKHPVVKERNGEGMDYTENLNFQSWEGTINTNPVLTFIPKTIAGLQNLVQWAKKENKGIRASAYRHSSSEVYADDNQILVSMLSLPIATELPAKLPSMDPNNEMQGIRLIGEPYEVDGKMKMLCKVGAATCNYHFLDWAHDPYGGNSSWTLPLNVIMSEISFGGSNAMICHGAGIKNKTISDLVKEIEFVNANGQVQIINDPEQIKAAAGCFGILGLVTSLTLELDQMSYANFKTAEKDLIALTIPPPPDLEIAPEVKKQLSAANLTALANREEMQKAHDDFVKRCEDSYYAEWFWFPLQEKGWINCWLNDGEKTKATRYPSPSATDLQKTGSYLAYLATNIIGDSHITIIKKIQTKLMGDLAMLMLPDQKDITCTLEDAIHFRKGIQNYKARMMEFELPVPNISNSNQPDWSICQKAWWAVIESVYSPENMEYFPMRTTLEMRIMGGSDILMAAQKQNTRTCAIEILTPVAVNAERWDKFLQEILDKWAKLKDDQGHFLNIRPHWAKRFDHLFINRNKSWINEWDNSQKIILNKYIKPDEDLISISMRTYLKTIAYKDQLPHFLQMLKKICIQGGYNYEDLKERFSNQFLDDLLSEKANPSIAHRFFQQFAKSQSYIVDEEKKAELFLK